jgi:hypothetical protein|tara:strand:+ start:2167 stop:2802 length:636 start_codon:yes stop_codon:yes gene_type:complete
MANTILQITKIEQHHADEIKLSFDNLPETDHVDGSYRLRKYSHVLVDCEAGIQISDLGVTQFKQSSKYNQHQGGMARNFNSIDEDVLQSPAMLEIVKVFMDACKFVAVEMDIHQMRVRCTGGATQLSPEGWHQDGYDCVAMIGITRCNIIGGQALLSTSKTEPPFLEAVMDPGTMIIIDDSHLWHNGRSIQPIDDSKPAYMDMVIFTAKRK